MRITEFSLRNPLVVGGLAVALCLFGLLAYAQMGVAVVPNVNLPVVIVTTTYPGADPETTETNVTKPIEDAIATLPNIDTNGLTSSSSSGLSTVSVQFTVAANPDLVSVDVQRVVNAARAKLPTDADPPTVTKVDPNAQAVATVIFSGKQPLTGMEDLAENVLQQQFNAIPGVGSTTIRSGVVREVQITVDQDKLRGRGLSINNVVGALQGGQLEVPAGTITQGSRDLSVYFDALAPTVDRLNDLVVAQTASGPVYLRQVARVEDTFKKRDTIARVDGQEGIALDVAKLTDANTISVVDGVRRKIAELQPRLPPDTRLDVVVDSAAYTSTSFQTVRTALLEAILITGLILFLFLHTWRSTLIVLVSIPISLLATLTVMSLLDYNLNLLTMLALTVSVGILVDDSIVVLENIHRHLAMGKAPRDAALEGRSEIGLAAITITLVDVVVYLPIVLMVTGIESQFLAPFAVTITIATLASLLVSFTVTPLLAGRLLSAHRRPEGARAVAGSAALPRSRAPARRFGAAWDRGFGWLERRYAALLRRALPNRWLVIAIGLATFMGGLSLLPFIGNDFFPAGDQSEIDVNLAMPPATSLDATNAVTTAMENDLHALPEVRSVYSVLGRMASGGHGGGQAVTGSDTAQIAVLLVRPRERARSSADIAESLRRQWEGTYPGAKIRVGLPNPAGFGGFGGAPIQVQVQGTDPAVLDQLASDVAARVSDVPGAVGIQKSNDNLQTQLRVTIDWTRAADLGVVPRDAGTALRAALDGFTATANQYRQTGRGAVPIRILAAKTTADEIARLPVSGAKGLVQLGQFADLRQTQIPTAIQHVNRLRSITIGVNAGNGVLVGDLQKAVANALKPMKLPPGYAVAFAGQGQTGGNSMNDITRALGVAVVLMYMLMMMLFRSITLPLAVLMSLPLAVVGALGGLALTRTPFTMFSLLGVAILLGLVGKNAILLVDYTDTLRTRGRDRTAALLEAGPTRLRPIIMTTVSIMAALLPIAGGLEEGSELLVSVAVVLIGGLLSSTLLTLVFVPAMYTVFDDVERGIVRLFQRTPREAVRVAEDGRASRAEVS